MMIAHTLQLFSPSIEVLQGEIGDFWLKKLTRFP